MRRVLFLLIVLSIPACEPKAPAPAAVGTPWTAPPVAPPVTFPELGEGQLQKDGVRVHKLTVDRRGVPMKLWVYQPPGAKAGEKRPCVFVAPAGSPMMIGMDLADGDAKEHFPYARRGYVVVSYTLDGAVPDARRLNAAILAGVRAYQASEAGLANAQVAIDFALAKLNVDADRLAVAGHSSAATHALMVARQDKRIKACVAFAPCLDVVGWLNDNMATLEAGSPGFRAFIRTTSPAEYPTEPACPTFLFHAKDDSVCPFAESATFATALAAANPAFKFVSAPRGGHYQSMIDEGIPAATKWLDGVFAAKK